VCVCACVRARVCTIQIDVYKYTATHAFVVGTVPLDSLRSTELRSANSLVQIISTPCGVDPRGVMEAEGGGSISIFQMLGVLLHMLLHTQRYTIH